jgi:ATP-binding cassette subfamily G (WHITE) protein 2 (SNQ2)
LIYLLALFSSTRGLDASTALEFVRALRISTDTFHLTTIVSIYQAGESLYNLFDKVCVIYEGKMAYFGPANQARQYFIDMGYEPANRQTTADFLVAVTDPNGRIPRPGVSSMPRTSIEFSEYFKKSGFGHSNQSDIESYPAEFVGVPERASAYMESAQAERAKNTRKDRCENIFI